jgi:DnaK suppressor protein
LENKRTEIGIGNRNREALAVETSPDDLDRIQHSQERELAIGAFDRNCTLLREVQAALIRMSAGRFGVCVDCEENINAKRLAAIPWASLCIVCREAADREQNAAGSEIDAPLMMAD